MKTLIKIFVILSLLILSGLFSCDDRSNPLVGTTEFTLDNFPHEIGTVWQYQYVHHFLASVVTDTVFVRINGTTWIKDDSLEVLEVIAEYDSDFEKLFITTYWHISGDTVTYYRPYADSFVVYQKIVFPLEVGSEWQSGISPSYSNFVSGVSNKSVLGKTYQNAFNIIALENTRPKFSQFSYWFVPNIGLIQSEFVKDFHMEPTSVTETWKLISFHEPDSFELSDFPQQVNASWEYKVYNNLLDCVNCFDTCTVTIIDSVMDRGGIIKSNWLFDYPGQERVINNSFDNNKLFLQWHHYPVYFSLEFPLTVGKQWTDGDLFISTSTVKVLGRQTVTTEAGTFEDAYYLKGQTGGFEPGTSFEIWIAKDIGIVKLLHNGAPMGSYEDKSWELKSYDPNKPAASFTIDKFPNFDEISWTYERYDYNTYFLDTILVQVAETSTVAIWTYTTNDSLWQEIVSLEGTVAKFFHPDNMIAPFKSYEFPIELGNSWITYPLGSRSAVVSLTPLLVSGIRFFPCYGIETEINCGDGCTHRETEWVSPHIGIVQRNFYIPHLGIHERWQLIEYTMPE